MWNRRQHRQCLRRARHRRQHRRCGRRAHHQRQHRRMCHRRCRLFHRRFRQRKHRHSRLIQHPPRACYRSRCRPTSLRNPPTHLFRWSTKRRHRVIATTLVPRAFFQFRKQRIRLQRNLERAVLAAGVFRLLLQVTNTPAMINQQHKANGVGPISIHKVLLVIGQIQA